MSSNVQLKRPRDSVKGMGYLSSLGVTAAFKSSENRHRGMTLYIIEPHESNQTISLLFKIVFYPFFPREKLDFF